MKAASELAGALFCLWGVFIVGGGSTAKQRVTKLCGQHAVNVYQNVSGPGREKRKTDFVHLWDSLSHNDSVHFEAISNSADACMKMMNATIKDLSANPWWLRWLSAGLSLTAAAAVGGIAYWYQRK